MHKSTRVIRIQDGEEVKSMMKKDMLRYVQDVRGMGQGLSDVLCKVRLVGARIKRREVVVGARRIRCEKLREHQ